MSRVNRSVFIRVCAFFFFMWACFFYGGRAGSLRCPFCATSLTLLLYHHAVIIPVTKRALLNICIVSSLFFAFDAIGS